MITAIFDFFILHTFWRQRGSSRFKEKWPICIHSKTLRHVCKNCRSKYSPGSYVIVDDQLAFRGGRPLRMHISNKPTKYGIKVVMSCDNNTNYMINGIPYVGKKTQTFHGFPIIWLSLVLSVWNSKGISRKILTNKKEGPINSYVLSFDNNNMSFKPKINTILPFCRRCSSGETNFS